MFAIFRDRGFFPCLQIETISVKETAGSLRKPFAFYLKKRFTGNGGIVDRNGEADWLLGSRGVSERDIGQRGPLETQVATADLERFRLNVERDGRPVLDPFLKFKMLVLQSPGWLSLDGSEV